MHAMVVEAERYGPPGPAYRPAVVPTPTLGPREVLVHVRAAGVNYNGVWAASGAPLDVIGRRRARGEPEPYHVGGSDGAGVVWAVGRDVTLVAPGDEVVVDGSGLAVIATEEPPGVLGYEDNHGTFAQFCRVRQTQCHPKPPNLSWVDAATLLASGGSAWRMLHHWAPHDVHEGDVVLVWGGAGGLGSMAIQIARMAGALPIAVVSGEDRAAWCREIGAVGVVDRRRFPTLGPLPDPARPAEYDVWIDEARAFGRAIWDAVGERRSPRIVVEHPGGATFPASVYVCAPGGMVVTCAATLGFGGSFDVRHAWVHEKRIQGCHKYDLDEARAVLDAVADGRMRSCTTEVVPFDQVGDAHQRLADNTARPGKIAVTVGYSDPDPAGG
jgi:crotonyl-CoA carboxylase/reductase